MWKTRWALLPLTVNRPAPGPLTTRSSVISSSALVRPMVPCSPGAKLTTSGPGCALALAIAWRSEPAPPSARLVTVKALGTVRSSRASSRGLGRAAGRQGAARRVWSAGRRWRRQRVHDMAESPLRVGLRWQVGGERRRLADRGAGAMPGVREPLPHGVSRPHVPPPLTTGPAGSVRAAARVTVGSRLQGIEEVVRELVDVVVAGGREIAPEHGRDEARHCLLAVRDAAALARAVCPAAATVTADGAVELDAATDQGGGNSRVRTGEQEQATTEPVTAVGAATAGTAESQVEGDGGVDERQRRVLREAQQRAEADRDAAAQPGATIVPAATDAADGRVAADRATANGGGGR